MLRGAGTIIVWANSRLLTFNVLVLLALFLLLFKDIIWARVVLLLVVDLQLEVSFRFVFGVATTFMSLLSREVFGLVGF